MADFQHLTAIIEESSYLTGSPGDHKLSDNNSDISENASKSDNSSEHSDSKLSKSSKISSDFLANYNFKIQPQIFIEESDQPDPNNKSPPEPSDQYLAPDPDHVRRVAGRRRMSLSGMPMGSQWKASGSQSSLTDVLWI